MKAAAYETIKIRKHFNLLNKVFKDAYRQIYKLDGRIVERRTQNMYIMKLRLIVLLYIHVCLTIL